MKVDLSKYNNSFYNQGSAIKRTVWYFVNLLIFKSGIFPFYSLKTFLLRMFGAKIGKGVVIKPNVNIKYPWLLEISDYCWIGENVWIDNLDKVFIGSNVCISQGALLLCGNHDFSKTHFDLIVNPIILEDGVWVGAKSIVCGGVTLYSHSVLSVSSVATTSMEAYGIYRGNPALKIKDRIIG